MEQIADKSFFVYIRELEYIVAVPALFADNLDGHLCRELYGEEFVLSMKRKYMELVELLNSLSLGGMEFLECMMSYEKPFTLEEYSNHMKKMPLVDFAHQFFGYHVSKEELEQALEQEEKLVELYEEGKFYINSFLNLKLILFQREYIIDRFFACVNDMKTKEAQEYLEECEKELPQLKKDLLMRLEDHTAGEIVSFYMKKKCCVEKVNEKNAFLPVFLLPRNAVVYVNQYYFVLYSNQKIMQQDKALNMLKILADDTRIRIIDLLSEKGNENGRAIAQYLNLAPSTVSHHMEQLIACKIVCEQKKGTAKQYMISRENAELLLEQLKVTLLKNNG